MEERDPATLHLVLDRLDAVSKEATRLLEEIVQIRCLLTGADVASQEAAEVAAPVEETRPAARVAPPEPEDYVVSQDDMRSPEDVLSVLFKAAAMSDNEAGFELFLQLMHPIALEGPKSRTSLRQFQWKQLRKNYREYLEDPTDTTSFSIATRRPEEPAPFERAWKLFVTSNRRTPVPITMRRLDDDPSRWRIEVCSL